MNGGKPVQLIYYHDPSKGSFLAHAYSGSPVVHLNTHHKRKCDDLTLQATLLHELGHIHDRHSPPSYVQREYNAHRWAILKAIRADKPNIAKRLIRMLIEWRYSNRRTYKRVAKIYWQKQRDNPAYFRQ